MNIVFYDGINWDYDVETPLVRPLGGSQSALCYLAATLAERGHRVALLNGTTNPRRVRGVDCYRVTAFPRELLARDADVVICLNGPGDICFALRQHVPATTPLVLWTQHAVDQSAMQPLARAEARDAWQLIVCVSSWHRASMIQTFHLDPNRTAILRNAVSPRFETLYHDEADFVDHKRGPTRLAYTSTPFRGLWPLVQLFPAVRGEFPDVELRVYSSMKVYQQGETEDPYRFIYEKCQSTPGIHYVGSISQTELAQELKQATILAYPNTFPETSCIAVMEAMAAGLHVVSSELGALPETSMGFATLAPMQGLADHDAFVARHRDVLLAVLRERGRDPQAFLRAKWAQVQQTNQTCVWHNRAREWENLLRPFARQRSPSATASPSTPDAIMLAMSHLRAGDLAACEQVCRSVLEADATEPQALELLARCCEQGGRTPEAARTWERLADILQKRGHADVALQVYQQALALDDRRGAAWNNLGKILQEKERFAEAEAAYRRAIELMPDQAQIHTNLGNVYMALNRLDAAERAHRQALALDPKHTGAMNNLATTVKRLGRFEEAQKLYEQTLSIDPKLAVSAYNLAVIHYQHDRLDEAEALFRQALATAPDFKEALHGLATALDTRGALGEAEAMCLELCRRFPEYAIGEAALATVLKSLGRIEESIAHYQRALSRMPPTSSLTSSMLQFCNYVPGMTLAKLAELHARWETQFGAPARTLWRPWPNTREPQRRLRIGFVSGDFRYHPVGRCIAPLLQYLERDQAEVVLYAQQNEHDDVTTKLAEMASRFTRVNFLSDDALDAAIRDDRIDVLFDLAGHTAGNRLGVLARKPAPVQFTWFGYVGTTGLSAIDYLLADSLHVPAEAEPHIRERVMRMPGCYAAFAPLAGAPDVAPPPVLQENAITFGSFSNPAKINDAVGRLWSEVLRRVPGSRLMLKFWGYENEATQRYCRERFTRHGIAGERILFSGRAQPRDMLAHYDRLDIALDPFPYGGGMTTCEALWMGVPVVTCPGEIFSSRHAYAYLTTVGLPELIASNFDEYVDKAVELAQDVERLKTLRHELRERVWSSPLCNARQFAADWMERVRQAWRDFTDKS
jgi:predicted O-linked N-acetylglucosamine transferase (SPINDLY family)